MAKSNDIKEGDNEFDIFRKRMMLAYRFRPNPLVRDCNVLVLHKLQFPPPLRTTPGDHTTRRGEHSTCYLINYNNVLITCGCDLITIYWVYSCFR